jgi:hypothetical protein
VIILYRNFPKTATPLTEAHFKNPFQMKYAKKFDFEANRSSQANEPIIGIGVTEFNYYILT